MKNAFCKFLVLSALGFLTSTCLGADPSPAHTLDIYWNDVEGGGATLIVTPAGESILIDSGNPGGRDAGRIYKTTQIAGLKKIDYYFTTHFHTDHYGGAAELSKLIPIGEVRDRGIPDSDPDHNPRATNWLNIIKPYRDFAADKRVLLHVGDTLPLKTIAGSPKLSFRCLGVAQEFVAPPLVPASIRFAQTPSPTNRSTPAIT